jgi:hypothetical protein
MLRWLGEVPWPASGVGKSGTTGNNVRTKSLRSTWWPPARLLATGWPPCPSLATGVGSSEQLPGLGSVGKHEDALAPVGRADIAGP